MSTRLSIDCFKAVAFQDEAGKWIGHFLDYNIGAQADNFEELERRMKGALQAEYEDSVDRCGVAFEGIDPSPQFFHDLWDGAAP